ncbi:FimB/Mfa2 family fimbrial subunit [Dysgonomonas termitidis]|uniref:FimB/Mfa2 family fimbrial subunit n=1 Tax=Dysgonomonas termitidis TaxID=1516126 RepID=A0ABV9L0B9_9BACT
MKPYISLFILLAFALLNSCIGEDSEYCPEIDDNSNLRLEFRYTDENGLDIFTDKVRYTDVFIFDSGDRLVKRITLDENALSLFAGTELRLEPGTYRIVCWANATANTLYEGASPGNNLFSDAFLSNSSLDKATNTASDSDPLYYAPAPSQDSQPQPFYVTVPESGSQTAVIPFRSAHITIGVYVKGFTDTSAQGAALPPTIVLTDIPAHYNFNMQTYGTGISYKKTAANTVIESQNMAYSEFYTPLFNENTPILLYIKKQSDGSTVATVSLKDFIADNNITVTGTDGLFIPIQIEFKSVSVEVTLPGWDSKPVSPEF